jgi:hypothetical protein
MHIYHLIQAETPRLVELIEEVYKEIGHMHHYLECKINESTIKKQQDQEDKTFPVHMTLHNNCPTPSYNQIVFRLLPEGIYILWMLPSKKMLKTLQDGQLEEIPDSMRQLIGWCHMFNHGLLQKIAKNLTKVSPEALMLVELSKPFHKRETKMS